MTSFGTDIKLAREMSLLDATLIGVGAMIGAGIFVLIGIAAGVAGPALILSFVLNGLIALLTAVSYAELGSCYHDAGGGYLWVKEGLPKWNGFLAGWMSWFAHAVACSLYALGFGAYFEHVLREFSIQLPQWAFLSPQKTLAGGAAVLLAYVNYRGASETGKLGNLVTVAKILILLVFSAFGLELILRSADPLAVFRDFAPHGASGVFKAMGLTFIAFQGFEVIAQSSEEIRNPRKNIPRAVFLSLLIVVPIYLVITLVALASVHPAGMSPWDYLAAQKEVALVQVARGFFAGGGVMILVGGLISTVSALNATIYSSSRVAFAMGRDRNFPGFFGRIHPKRRTPHWSILVSAVIIVTMALSLPIEAVASAADIMFLLLFLQVNLAMISLRKKRPDLDRGFKVPLFPYLTIAGIGLLLLLAVFMLGYSLIAWAVALGWIGIGLLVYRFYASSREIEQARRLLTLDRLSKREYRILVLLEGEGADDSLVSLSLALAASNGASLIFLKVVEVPPGRRPRLEDGRRAAEDEVLATAAARAAAAGLPARGIVGIAHRASLCLLETAHEEECNLVLLSRPRGEGFLGRVRLAVFDSVLREATSEIAVLSGPFDGSPPSRVTVLFGDDPHSRLALDMGLSLAPRLGSRLHVAFAAEEGRATLGEGELRAAAEEAFAAAGAEPSAARFFRVDDPASLYRRAVASELLLVGRSAGGFLESLLGNSPQSEIQEAAPCAVLGFTEYQEPRSLLSRLLGRGERKEQTHGH